MHIIWAACQFISTQGQKKKQQNVTMHVIVVGIENQKHEYKRSNKNVELAVFFTSVHFSITVRLC